VRVYVGLKGDALSDVAFEASGCAICLASASLMTENTHGYTIQEARLAIDNFEHALTTDGSLLTGDLAALGGVSQYPSRIRCATLPWKTLRAALDASSDTVTTE
jgi:nitrogen fixation NifU-like protein